MKKSIIPSSPHSLSIFLIVNGQSLDDKYLSNVKTLGKNYLVKKKKKNTRNII